MTEQDNNWYVPDVPFNVEFVFKGSINKETESKLMDAMYHGTELLPGLYIHKLYKASLDKEGLQSAQMAEDFAPIKEQLQAFLDKWYYHGYEAVGLKNG